MRILEYFSLPAQQQAHWRRQIGDGDWRAAGYLHSLLESGAAKERYGEELRLLLLTGGDTLAAFCIYSMRDEIEDPSMFPWVGFVYTFPRFRGHRYSQRLIDHACGLARQDGFGAMYLTSDEVGLYEKYDFVFLEKRLTMGNEWTSVYVRKL